MPNYKPALFVRSEFDGFRRKCPAWRMPGKANSKAPPDRMENLTDTDILWGW